MTAKPPPKTFNLLKYHRPKLHSYRSSIPPLSKQSKQCLQNLAAYRAPKSRLPYPRSRCAAVLVALFVGRMGDLYVLLNRRSANLRTYAGDTSLPGGRVEDSDATFEEAARREAFEEVDLFSKITDLSDMTSVDRTASRSSESPFAMCHGTFSRG